MRITLENINELQKDRLSLITSRMVLGTNSKPLYSLENTLPITLSDGKSINIPKGFIWDASSVPRFMWNILPAQHSAEMASLIHDYLYVHKIGTRKFADNEMYKWAKKINGAHNLWSLRNLDNAVRYYGVRLFGWIVWNKKKR